jgi:two-component system, chemotaxis family, chemotaxis protein CheY
MSTPVLVVDDSGMARKMLIKALPASWDIEITQAANGIEAVAAYRAGKAEIIFLDLQMPEMDGYEVLEQIRKEDFNAFVIVVSADVQPLAQQRVKEMGAMAFIKKPVNPEEIEAVLKKYGVVL